MCDVSIEVISVKRGRCIRCHQPGRKRRVKAKSGRVQEKMEDILCMRCARAVGVTLKWSVVYARKPSVCMGIVELGMTAQEARG
jgi:hypothetical protein